MAAFILIVLILFLIGSNEAIGYYFSHCSEADIFDCLMGQTEEDEAAPEGAVAATGTYEWKGYTVDIVLNIPLQGGAVTGTVSGTCEGSIRGTYSGQNNGVISGNMSGTCAPFFVNIPASATYTGTVNKTGKTVPIQFDGRGGGLTKKDGLTLVFP